MCQNSYFFHANAYGNVFKMSAKAYWALIQYEDALLPFYLHNISYDG